LIPPAESLVMLVRGGRRGWLHDKFGLSRQNTPSVWTRK
jgi:predicted 3-demethylubiquinone-9 3-methyltransferase (glyoxalase superfamily)